MIFDGTEEKTTLGTYGSGLAAAFSPDWRLLKDLPNVIQFSRVKLSVGGGFQFDMNGFQSDSPILCDYLQMAADVKRHYRIDPKQVHWFVEMSQCICSQEVCMCSHQHMHT